MKILIFCPYYPPHVGGLETHSDEFNRYLSQRGSAITVFTPRIPLESPEHETLHTRVEIIRFPAFEIVSNYPLPKFWSPAFWKLFLPLFKEHYDIVISRTRFFFTSAIALFYTKLTHTKWVHIEHGSDFVKLSSRFKTGVAKTYDHLLGRLIFRCSDLNISISRAVQSFVKKFDSRPSPIIYRGMDFEYLASITPNPEFKKSHPEKILIGVVARLYKWKGIEYSIRAIQSLPKELQSQIQFIIIGDGEDFNRLQAMIASDNIIMLGNLPRTEAVGILKTFDIYIHSSLPGGGLSTSLLEAMQSGCAPIAAPNEGADEIITHNFNGLLVKDQSPESIQEAIIRLLKDPPLREKFQKEAHNTVQRQFSWDEASQKYLDIFTNISRT
jgi:glycosyltransferase involved in cell wall biosynthesis